MSSIIDAGTGHRHGTELRATLTRALHQNTSVASLRRHPRGLVQVELQNHLDRLLEGGRAFSMQFAKERSSRRPRLSSRAWTSRRVELALRRKGPREEREDFLRRCKHSVSINGLVGKGSSLMPRSNLAPAPRRAPTLNIDAPAGEKMKAKKGGKAKAGGAPPPPPPGALSKPKGKVPPPLGKSKKAAPPPPPGALSSKGSTGKAKKVGIFSEPDLQLGTSVQRRAK